MYDGRVGRWMTTDPYSQYHSPYLAMGNDPINQIDPDGGWAGTVTGLVVVGVIAGFTDGWNWKSVSKGALSGAAAGAMFDFAVGTLGVGPLVAGGLAGGAGDIVAQSLDYFRDDIDISFKEIGYATIAGVALGPLGDKVSGGVASLGTKIAQKFVPKGRAFVDKALLKLLNKFNIKPKSSTAKSPIKKSGAAQKETIKQIPQEVADEIKAKVIKGDQKSLEEALDLIEKQGLGDDVDDAIILLKSEVKRVFERVETGLAYPQERLEVIDKILKLRRRGWNNFRWYNYNLVSSILDI